MTHSSANLSLDQRRAGIRRTAWITGALAFAFFVAFFVIQAMTHK